MAPTTWAADRPTWAAVRAAAVAGTVSGAPSTLHALATGRSPLAATRAAGALVGRPTVPAGAVVHAVLSLAWATALRAALVAALPQRTPGLGRAGAGAVAGVLVAALDLGLVGRRVPAVRALPLGPQVVDHALFGAVVGLLAGDGAPTTDEARVDTATGVEPC